MRTKKECRLYYQSLRNSLTEEERKVKSEAIAEHYIHLFQLEKPQVVHLFLPIATKSEVNAFIILNRLNETFPQVKTVTSVIAEDNESLLTIEVRSDMEFKTNGWGIPEPVIQISFPALEIDEVLTPLLAIDQQGYRLGYGKGFYDRFFATCKSTVKRTGINFFPVVKEELPKDEWDIPLHRLISPEGLQELHKNK